MQVPVRREPQTRPSEQQLAYERPADPLNTSPLTRSINDLRDTLQEGQDDRQRVDLNRRLLDEVNWMQGDFARRETDPSISPIDFATNTNTEYAQRHQQLAETLRQQHYNPDLIDDFENRLGTVRQGFFERGIQYQTTQLRARAGDEINDVTRSASQYAAIDPLHNYLTARDMLENSIRIHPDLTEENRIQLRNESGAILRDGAMRAYAIQHPQDVIDHFDPQGLTAPIPTVTNPTPENGVTTPHSFTSRPGADRIMNYEARAAGFQSVPPEVQTLGQASDFALQVNRAGVRSSAMGLYQIVGDTMRHMAPQVFGPNWRDQPFNVDTQDQLARAIFDATKGSVQALRGQWASLSPAEAERIRHLPWEQARGVIAEHESNGNIQNVEVARAGAPISGGSQLVDDPTVQAVDIPASSASPAPTIPENSAAAPAQPDISSIHTGVPLLDDLNGRERIQLLGLAREQLNRTTVAQRAQMDVTIHNITAEAMNNGGEIATPIPSEQDVLRTYGPVEGPQHWAQIQQSQQVGQAITSFRTQSAEQIQHSLDAINPQLGSPTYATRLEIYHHAQEAAQHLLEQRQHDPAGYVMQYFPEVRAAAQQGTAQYYAALDRAYTALGIDTNTAPVMTTEAAREMAQQYIRMNPDQRRQFMVQNWTMGEDRFRRFVHGMEGTPAESDANIFALLRSYPMAAGPSSVIFQDVLIGRDAIARDPARKPRDIDITRQFRTLGLSAIRDLDPNASRAIQDATEGLYVQRGGNNADGTMNTSLYQDSLRTILGGSLPVQMGHGQTSGYYTILPPGTTQEQFRNWIDRQTLYSLSIAAGQHAPYYGDGRTPVPIEDIINSGTFVMTSPGRYMVRMASDGRPLVTRNGQPFLLNIGIRDVRGPTPTRHWYGAAR